LCLYVVLSCVGIGLCDGLITRPEASYRVSVCVWSRNPEKGGQRSILDYKRPWINKWIFTNGTLMSSNYAILCSFVTHFTILLILILNYVTDRHGYITILYTITGPTSI
jgi:hypothetical protein